MKKPLSTPHRTVVDIFTGDFRERKGYATWRENGTNDWLIIYTIGGKGRLGHTRGEIVVGPGDITLLKPGALHDYGVEERLERWDFLWAHFQPRAHWLDLLRWPEMGPGLMRLRLERPLRQQVEREMRAMHAAATGASRRKSGLALCALEKVLLLCDQANPLMAQAGMDARVREAMEFLCRNLSRKIALEELAGHVKLSVSRMAHLFREHTGTTPQQFLEVQRLERAQQLLAHTPHAIKQIAYRVGFESPFYFTLRFKRYTGKSPREWRKGA